MNPSHPSHLGTNSKTWMISGKIHLNPKSWRSGSDDVSIGWVISAVHFQYRKIAKTCQICMHNYNPNGLVVSHPMSIMGGKPPTPQPTRPAGTFRLLLHVSSMRHSNYQDWRIWRWTWETPNFAFRKFRKQRQEFNLPFEKFNVNGNKIYIYIYLHLVDFCR